MSTSKAKRINPNRILNTTQNTTQSGIKRIVLSVPEAAENIPEVKPLRTPTKPKNFFLTVTHADRGMLDDHANQVIASAAILADKETAVVALVLGELREEIASLGADKVMVRPEFDYQIFQPDAELACVLKVIDSLQPSRIFMPDNMIGDGELGRRLIATQPSKSVATHVIEIDAKHVASYQAGGSLLAYADLPDIILLAPNTAETNLPFIASAIPDEQLKSISYTFKESNSDYKDPYKNLGMLPVASATIALEEADFIVSAGNGVSNVETLETLAHSLDAAIGASRVAVDDGKFPRDKQIGASGKTVSASAYLAIGISGAVQHLQGIKDCRHVIAINRDNSAPIVKRADLTIIGDAEEIMQSLILAIAEAKQATSNQTISNPVS
jgi:electron transfer flavoprotein alpha subunit